MHKRKNISSFYRYIKSFIFWGSERIWMFDITQVLLCYVPYKTKIEAIVIHKLWLIISNVCSSETNTWITDIIHYTYIPQDAGVQHKSNIHYTKDDDTKTIYTDERYTIQSTIHILTGGQLGSAGGILAWMGRWWGVKLGGHPGLGVPEEQDTGEEGTTCKHKTHGDVTQLGGLYSNKSTLQYKGSKYKHTKSWHGWKKMSMFSS